MKINTKVSPLTKLAKKEPNIEPVIIPRYHFFIMLKSTFLSLICDLTDEIEVKKIIPREEATAICIMTDIG